MLLHSAVSLQRRQFCRPNSVLFMQKPSQKSARTQGCSGCCSIIHQAEKCILIEVPLNLGHHFSQLFFFFTSFFFLQLCVMHRQRELHLTTLHPTGTMTVNLYQFQLFIMQKPIHAKLSPHNALIASALYPAACAR